MTARYRLTPRAREGLLGIASHVVDRFGRVVAERVVDDLIRAFELLAENPGVGHRREDLTRDPRVLFWPVGPTLIAYRRASDGVQVLLVERAELDWEEIMLVGLQ